MNISKILNPILGTQTDELHLTTKKVKNPEIIKTAKKLAVKRLINTAEEIRNNPSIYRQRLNGPANYWREAELKDNRYYIIKTSWKGILTLSRFSDGSGPVNYDEIEDVQDIIVSGLKLEDILKLQEGLNILIDRINEKIKEEEVTCQEFILAMQEEAKSELTEAELEEIELLEELEEEL